MPNRSSQSQLVRDLLWVVNSPSFCEGTNVAPQGSLDVAAVDAVSLERFMASRAEHRVGRYFEHLLLYWLTEVRGVEMVGNGIQIRDGKRTIGEIDYLYSDEAGRVIHCEASVKFFLHHPRSGTSHFPGPNATDNYERKIAKLFDQQLQLSRTHYPEVTHRHAFVKGMVFYRHDVPAPAQLPDRLPSAHLRGRWLAESELDELAVVPGAMGVVADKPLWLAPQPKSAALPVADLADLLTKHFATKGHPVMVNLFGPDGDDETDRLCVVPDRWPD